MVLRSPSPLSALLPLLGPREKLAKRLAQKNMRETSFEFAPIRAIIFRENVKADFLRAGTSHRKARLACLGGDLGRPGPGVLEKAEGAYSSADTCPYAFRAIARRICEFFFSFSARSDFRSGFYGVPGGAGRHLGVRSGQKHPEHPLKFTTWRPTEKVPPTNLQKK